MQITSKGQVTIPQEIREQMGFLPHAEIDFILKNGRVYLQKAQKNSRGSQLINAMRGKGDIKMSTEQIMALTRG
jgi:AbrB family looped-hinge helix DNA binding protein